jgi:hypothetical protein
MKIKVLLIVGLLFFIIPQPVAAYLDPGVGSMVWQMIVVALLSVAFTLKIYWLKLKSFFTRSKTKKPLE